MNMKKEMIIVASVLFVLSTLSIVGIVKYVKYEMRKPEPVVAQAVPQHVEPAQHAERTH